MLQDILVICCISSSFLLFSKIHWRSSWLLSISLRILEKIVASEKDLRRIEDTFCSGGEEVKLFAIKLKAHELSVSTQVQVGSISMRRSREGREKEEGRKKEGTSEVWIAREIENSFSSIIWSKKDDSTPYTQVSREKIIRSMSTSYSRKIPDSFFF